MSRLKEHNDQSPMSFNITDFVVLLYRARIIREKVEIYM